MESWWKSWLILRSRRNKVEQSRGTSLEKTRLLFPIYSSAESPCHLGSLEPNKLIYYFPLLHNVLNCHEAESLWEELCLPLINFALRALWFLKQIPSCSTASICREREIRRITQKCLRLSVLCISRLLYALLMKSHGGLILNLAQKKIEQILWIFTGTLQKVV